MHASGRRVEEAGVGAVEAVQAVLRVLGGVAVHHVQQHHNAHGVGHVDQLLQLVGGAVAAGRHTQGKTEGGNLRAHKLKSHRKPAFDLLACSK